MTRNWEGIYPSTICPMDGDGLVDEAAVERHVAGLMAVPGIVGILCNGHAGENFLLSAEEQRGVVAATRRAMGSGGILVAGVNAESSAEAAALARSARREGADAVLVFPPFSWAVGQDEEIALRHHVAILDAAPGPAMLFQGSVGAGTTAYRPDVLAKLVALPDVVGIKEGSWETAAYEANRRLVKSVRPEVAVMASGDEHLLSCYAIGSEGSQVSLAVVIPEAIVELDAAVRASDLPRARAAHAIVYPLAKAIYGTAPAGHATARLKTCLRLLGRLESDAVRAPLSPVRGAELDMLRAALGQAGLKV